MGKSLILKILFALVVICVQECTSDYNLDEIDYIWQAKHWDQMTWFDKIIGAPIKKNKRVDVEVKNQLWTLTNISIAAKIKIISLLMECVYGKELVDFLWISTYTVIQCGELLKDGDNNVVDCWQKLEDSLKKGAVITYKLWAMNERLSNLDKRIIDENRFYKILPQVCELLNRPQPYLTVMVSESLYKDIEDLANLLVTEWNKNCHQSYSVVSQEKLLEVENERPDLNETPKPLHDLYVDKLNSIINFIKQHSEKIGYRYNPPEKTVTFSNPTRIDGILSSHQN